MRPRRHTVHLRGPDMPAFAAFLQLLVHIIDCPDRILAQVPHIDALVFVLVDL